MRRLLSAPDERMLLSCSPRTRFSSMSLSRELSPMTLTWQDLRDVDRKLALNIERFYSDYKTSIDSSR